MKRKKQQQKNNAHERRLAIGVISSCFLLLGVYLAGVFSTTSMMSGHKSLQKDITQIQTELAQLQQGIYTATTNVLATDRARAFVALQGEEGLESQLSYISAIDESRGDDVALR